MMVHDYMIIYARRNLYVNNTARLNFLILIYCRYSDPVKTSPLLWYVTLVDIAETTILVPYIYATSLQLIWRFRTRGFYIELWSSVDSIFGYPILQWVFSVARIIIETRYEIWVLVPSCPSLQGQESVMRIVQVLATRWHALSKNVCIVAFVVSP